VYTSVVPPAPVIVVVIVVIVVVVVVALIDLSLSSFLLPLWIAHKYLKTTHPECNGPAPINRFEEYLVTNRVLLTENQHFSVVQYWQDRYESQLDLAQFVLDILAVPLISNKYK
jgi:hypothetical protein